MASTYTLQRSINWAQTYAQLRPLTGLGGFTNEPALSLGDWVREFILAPPFAWRWNRAKANFSASIATQDYPVTAANFGWLEKAMLTNGSSVVKELEIRMDLAEDSTQSEPSHISPYIDDGAGHITFRLFPTPDQNYTVNLTYQNGASLFAALTDTWSPVPDYFSFLYNQGVLAKVYEQMGDERSAFALQLFLKQVIAANGGLSDSQKNLFLEERLTLLRETQGKQLDAQLTRAGRGLYGQGQ